MCAVQSVPAHDPLPLFERWLQVVAQEPALAELLLVLLVVALGLLLLGLLRRQARLLSQREALADLCLGAEHSLAGDHERAVERLTAVVERDGRNAEARILLGNSLRALGRPAEAHAQHLEVAQVLREHDRTATLAVARDLLARGSAAEAATTLEAHLAAAAPDAEALELLAEACHGAGRFDAAADALARRRDLGTDDATAARLIRREAAWRLAAGEARLAQERPDLAVTQLEQAVALDPLLLPARSALVTALSRSGRGEAAAHALGTGLRLLAAHGPATAADAVAPGDGMLALPADSAAALPQAAGADPLALPAARALATRWLLQRPPYRCSRCGAPRSENQGACPECASPAPAEPTLAELAAPLAAIPEVMDEIEETRSHVRKLVRWLWDPDPARRATATRKLVELRERAVAECFEAAVHSSEREPIAAVLHAMGAAILPALVQAFQDHVQRGSVLAGLLPGRSAVQALSDLVRGFGPTAVPFFQGLLGSDDRDLRKVVLDYFLGLASHGELEALRHWFPAVEVLLRINQMEPEAVGRLAAAAQAGGFLCVLLADEAFRHDAALLETFATVDDRTALTEVLARRTFSPPIAAGLIEALNEPQLRSDARAALARHGKAALDQLVAAFADQDRPAEARGEVRSLLLELGTSAVRELCTCFGPDPAPLDADVVTILVAMGPDALAELETMLDTPRGWLGWLVPLRARTDHPRARVIEAIGRIGGPAAEELLRRRLLREGDAHVRHEIERWLTPPAAGAQS